MATRCWMALPPTARSEIGGLNVSSRPSWLIRLTVASSASSSSAPAWRVPRQGQPWARRAITSRVSATRTAHAGRTPLRPRAASMPRKTTRATATRRIGCSTTRSRVGTTARVSPTSTAWPRSALTSSTSAWPKVCRLLANTVACWITAPSVACRSRGRSTPEGKRASSC